MSLGSDLVVGLRHLRTHAGFALLAVCVLGVGIGGSSMFFTLVDAICLRGLPIERPDRVLFFDARDRDNRPFGMSYEEYLGFQERLPEVVLGAYAASPFTIGDAERPVERVAGAYATSGMFATLGARAVRGRTFTSEDDAAGSSPVVLLSQRVWRNQFSGNPAIVGATLRVNGIPATVIGIIGGNVRYPGNTDVWLPLGQMPALVEQPRDARVLSIVGRLPDTARLADVAGAADALWQQWSTERQDVTRDLRAVAVPINDRFNGRITDPVWMAFSTVGALVLLVACANVANLLLMRAASRTHEIAVRASLGATRKRLFRQFLAESAVIAIPSALLGLALAQAGIAAIFSIVPTDVFPYWIDYGVNLRVVGALVLMAGTSVIVFGFAPALHMARAGTHNSLRGGVRGATGARDTRQLTSIFLVTEFALTLVMLAGIALGIQQARTVQRTEHQIDGRQVLSAWLTLPPAAYATPDARQAIHDALLRDLPGVAPGTVAAMATHLPGGGGSVRELERSGETVPAGSTRPTVLSLGISAQYFEALGVPIVRGRALTNADNRPGAATAVVNQRFTDLFLAGRDPIGQVIRLAAPDRPDSPWLRIVGVIPTVRQRDGALPDPVVYRPLEGEPPATTVILLRADGDPVAFTAALRQRTARLDASLPLDRVMRLDTAMAAARWNGRVSTRLLTTMGIATFLLALVGLYAVTAHAVGTRRREIGIRMALGASPVAVRWLVLARALRQLTIGLAAGVAATYVFDRFVAQSTADAARMTDPLVLAPVILSVFGVAAAACLLPATRAAGIDPAHALRAE